MNALLTNGLIVAGPENPFEGVTPDPTAFGSGINSILVLLLGGVWGIVLVVIAIMTLIQLAKWGSARQDARSEDMTEAAAGFKRNLIVFGCTAGVGIIFGAILFIVNTAG